MIVDSKESKQKSKSAFEIRNGKETTPLCKRFQNPNKIKTNGQRPAIHVCPI